MNSVDLTALGCAIFGLGLIVVAAYALMVIWISEKDNRDEDG